MYVDVLRHDYTPTNSFIKPGANTDAGYDLSLADDAIILPLSKVPRTLYRVADIETFDSYTLDSIGYKDGALPKDSPFVVMDGGLWQMEYKPPLYRTGIHTLPRDADGVWFMVALRSSSSTKNGLRLHNSIGVIDAEYQGEILLSLYSAYDTPMVLPKGTRVAQIIPMSLPRMVPVMTTDASILELRNNRGGGFGSTNDPGMSGSNVLASFDLW